MGLGQAAHLGDALGALHLRDVADREEDRRLGQAVHGHLQQSGEIAERAGHAEGEHDDAHVLDRRVGEHAFDVAPAIQHERGEDQRQQAERDHQRAGRDGARVGADQHLEAQQRVQRDVQQQARQHGGDRRRTFGVRVRQPGVHRRQADLGAVAQQQEDEGDVEQRRIEVAGAGEQRGPDHRVHALAEHRAGGEIDQDGAEQRQRDADAAEDEVFPRGLDRLVRAVDADHQHGGQRGEFHRDPHQADVVGDQRQVHAEQHELVHGVVESQVARGEAAGFQFVADIAGAERAGGEADEGVEQDEDDVQVVDQQVLAGRRAVEQQADGEQEGRQAGEHVEQRGDPVGRDQRQERCGGQRDQQDGEFGHL